MLNLIDCQKEPHILLEIKWDYRYKSSNTDGLFYTTLSKLRKGNYQIWIDSLEHSDEQIRFLGISEVKKSIKVDQSKSKFWDSLLSILPVLLLDEQLSIRKEAI